VAWQGGIRCYLAFTIQSLVALSQSGGAVSGRLLAPDGTPMANVRVGLSPVEDSAGASASMLGIVRTDAAGRYRISQAPTGRYYVVAGLVDAPTYFPGVITRAAATILEVADRAVLETPDFRLAAISKGLRILGRVESETVPINRTLMPIVVRLTGGTLGTPISAPVAVDGSFEFSELRGGQYQATVGPNIIMFPAAIALTDKDVDFRLTVRIITDEMIATAASQLKGRPILVGDVALQLSERDIMALKLALPSGGEPWLLIGSRTQTSEERLEVYISPDPPVSGVRRGSMILLNRNPPDSVWTIATATAAYPFPGIDRNTAPPARTVTYAQVAVAGRDFDDVKGEQDDNRPFLVAGPFEVAALSSLAAFVRGMGQPIVSVVFMPDGSARVLLRRQAMSFNWLMLLREGPTWTVVQQGALNITRR
jgi:hypothetical protein